MFLIREKKTILLCTMLSLATASVSAAKAAQEATLPITQNGKPAASIVILGGASQPLLDRAAATVNETVRRWGGAELPVVRITKKDRPLPADCAVVLTTLDDMHRLEPSLESAAPEIGRVAFLDEEGFACAPADAGRTRRMLVVSRTPRGVFNGAVYLRDFCLDGTRERLVLRPETTVQTPQMQARGTYCLSIYGVIPQYTVQDWKPIFDRFARDGMNRIYFWTSGHFPSKKFPQTYNRDATTGTKIGTLDDLRELIRYAHSLGMKFYLGSGVFAWANAAYLTENVPGTQAVKAGGLCPSNPIVRQRTHDYFMEMIDSLPEADGFFLEMRDEHGECQCPVCQKPIDEYGSKQYGQSEITFLQELAADVWRKHPQAHFALNIGYAEHKNDVAYYRQIRDMSDPRFEWLECRQSWALPGPDGQLEPLAYFSRHVIHWDPFYSRPLSEMVTMSNRTAREGLFGYVPAYEPGFATASYYSNMIPFPVDWLPYAATGFAYRELTWEPSLNAEELQQRFQQRFCGQEAPAGLGKDLFELRDWVVANAQNLITYSQDWISYDTRRVPHPVLADAVKKATPGSPEANNLRTAITNLQKVRDEGLPFLARIEQDVTQARAGAGPKTAETLDMMQRAIDDSRKYFRLSVPDPSALDEYQKRLEAQSNK